MQARVLVVGGGLSGLCCAFDLASAGVDVRLIEAAPRLGGVIQTRRANGFQFEDGPNTVPGTARHLIALAHDLGIAQRLVPSLPETKTRYLFHRGQLVPLPLKPPQLLGTPLLSLAGKLRLLSEPWRRLGRRDPEPTFADFLAARIGREAAERLGGAFVRGVYAAEASDLGAASAFPRVYDKVLEHGSLFRALRAARRESPAAPAQASAGVRTDGALLSFPDGFGELVSALADKLGEARTHLNRPVQALHPPTQSGDGAGWTADLAEERIQAEHVVLALPAEPTARLLGSLVPDPQLETLRRLPHADVTVVHVGWQPRAPSRWIPPGFGFLVPPEESGEDAPAVLGMLFPSNLFPGRAPEGSSGLSAIYRTADRKDMSQEQLVTGVLTDLEKALGPRPEGEVVASACVRWPRAIPHYGVGHRERVGSLLEVASTHAGLHLAGNWHGGISVDDRIAAGRAAAARVLREVSP